MIHGVLQANNNNMHTHTHTNTKSKSEIKNLFHSDKSKTLTNQSKVCRWWLCLFLSLKHFMKSAILVAANFGQFSQSPIVLTQQTGSNVSLLG